MLRSMAQNVHTHTHTQKRLEDKKAHKTLALGVECALHVNSDLTMRCLLARPGPPTPGALPPPLFC